MTPPSFQVDPADDGIDMPRRIGVSGLAPGEIVEISSEQSRTDGSVWQASAVFEAGADGTVSLTTQAPIRGSYSGISPMGIVWSQTRLREPDTDRIADPLDSIRPITIELIARTRVGTRIHGSFIQRYMMEGVERREINEDGLVGTLFLPKGAGPHPAIMILNGSGGGINEQRAALYASHGYAALALGYFGAPGLPRYISNLPLEYFQKGWHWIRRELRPANDFVAIAGQSRGGELVLLLGALFPEEISAILAYVPSAYVHSGQSAADPQLGRNSATWLFQDKPLPHLWEDNRTGTWEVYDSGPVPRRLEYAMKTALADQEAVGRCRIPVENIRAPLLLVHGTDDGSWPTDYFCDVVEKTLKDNDHRHPFKRLRFVGAGHSIRYPYIPTTLIVHPHAVSGIVATDGGTPEANAVADVESWAGALDFLKEAVDAQSRA